MGKEEGWRWVAFMRGGRRQWCGRWRGKILCVVTRRDLFAPAPALAQAGLHPDRLIQVEAGDEQSLLACFEEGLRHGRLGAVVAETACR